MNAVDDVRQSAALVLSLIPDALDATFLDDIEVSVDTLCHSLRVHHLRVASFAAILNHLAQQQDVLDLVRFDRIPA